ncbi:hypothetical protein IJH16_00660 [Candidatus Saccharibacteria bacterium]|nr:hypothetical protein [Candidatus Saccharibacteria bacterium]
MVFPPTPPNARRYPLSYVISGRYDWSNGNLYYQDSVGNWWSTTAYSGSNAYNLYMNSSSLGPQSNNTKAHGFPLRSTKYPSVSAFVCTVWSLSLGQ